MIRRRHRRLPIIWALSQISEALIQAIHIAVAAITTAKINTSAVSGFAHDITAGSITVDSTSAVTIVGPSTGVTPFDTNSIMDIRFGVQYAPGSAQIGTGTFELWRVDPTTTKLRTKVITFVGSQNGEIDLDYTELVEDGTEHTYRMMLTLSTRTDANWDVVVSQRQSTVRETKR